MAAEADIPEPIPLLQEKEEIKYLVSDVPEFAKALVKSHAGDSNIPSEQKEGSKTERTGNMQPDTAVVAESMKLASEGHLQISDSTGHSASRSGTLENRSGEACKISEQRETNEISRILAEKKAPKNEEQVESDGIIQLNKGTGPDESQASEGLREVEKKSGTNHIILVSQASSSEEHQTESGTEVDELKTTVGEGTNRDENPVKSLANEEGIEVVDSIEDASTSTPEASTSPKSHYEMLESGNSDEKELENPTENTSSSHEQLEEASTAKVEGSWQMVEIIDEPTVVTGTTDKVDDTIAEATQEADEKPGKIEVSDDKMRREGLGAAVAEADIRDTLISQNTDATEGENKLDKSSGDSHQETEEPATDKHAEPLTSDIPDVDCSATSNEKAETNTYLEHAKIKEEKLEEEAQGDKPPHHDAAGEGGRPEEKNQPAVAIIQEMEDLEVNITKPNSSELGINSSSTETGLQDKSETLDTFTNSEMEEPTHEVNGSPDEADERALESYEARQSTIPEHAFTDKTATADLDSGKCYERDKASQDINNVIRKEGNDREEANGTKTEGDLIEKGIITTEKLLDVDRSVTCTAETMERHVQVDSLLIKSTLAGEKQSYGNDEDNDIPNSAEVQECTQITQNGEKIEERLKEATSAQLPSKSTGELVEGYKDETDNESTSKGEGKGELITHEVEREISSESVVEIPVCNVGYDKTTADNILDLQDTHLEMKGKDELSEATLTSSENEAADLKTKAGEGTMLDENLDGESKNQTVSKLDIALEQKQQASPDAEVSTSKKAEAEVDQACYTKCIEDAQGAVFEEFKHVESDKNLVTEDGADASILVDSAQDPLKLTEGEGVDRKTYNEIPNIAERDIEEQHVPSVNVSSRHEPSHEEDVKLAEAATISAEDMRHDNTEAIGIQGKNIPDMLSVTKPEQQCSQMAGFPDEAEVSMDCQPHSVIQESQEDNNETEIKEKAAQVNETASDKCRGSELNRPGSCTESEVTNGMDEKPDILRESDEKRDEEGWAAKVDREDNKDKEINQRTNETEQTQTGELKDEAVTGEGIHQPGATGAEKLAKAQVNEAFEDNHSAASSENAEANSKLEGDGSKEEKSQEKGEEKLPQPAASSESETAEEKNDQPAEIYETTRDWEVETVNKDVNSNCLDVNSSSEKDLRKENEKQETSSKPEIEETVHEVCYGFVETEANDGSALESNGSAEKRISEAASADETPTFDLLDSEKGSETNEAVGDIKDARQKVETFGVDTYVMEGELHKDALETKTILADESKGYQSEDADLQNSTEVHDDAEIICSSETVQEEIPQMTTTHLSSESVEKDLAEEFKDELKYIVVSSKEGSEALIKADSENDASAELVGEIPDQDFQNEEKPETAAEETIPYETYQNAESPKALQSDNQNRNAKEICVLESEDYLKQMVDKHDLQEKLKQTLPVTSEESKTIKSGNSIMAENTQKPDENEQNEEKFSGGTGVHCIADIASEKEGLDVQTPDRSKSKESTTSETEAKPGAEMLRDGDSFITEENSEEEIIKGETKEVYQSPEIHGALEESVTKDPPKGSQTEEKSNAMKLEQLGRSECENADRHDFQHRSIEEPEAKVDQTADEGNNIALTSEQEISRTVNQEIEEVHTADDSKDKETCQDDDQENQETAYSMEGVILKTEKEDQEELTETLITEPLDNKLEEDITSASEEHMQEVEDARDTTDQTQETTHGSQNMCTETAPLTQAQKGTLLQKEEISNTSPNVYEEKPVEMEKQMHEDFFTSEQIPDMEKITEQNSNEQNHAATLCEEEHGEVNDGFNSIKTEQLAVEKGSIAQEPLAAPLMDVQLDEGEAGDLVTKEAEEKRDEDKENPASTYTKESEESKYAIKNNIILESNNCDKTIATAVVEEPVETTSSYIILDDNIHCSQNIESARETRCDLASHFQIKDPEKAEEQNLTVTLEQLGTDITCEDVDKHVSKEDNSTKGNEEKVEQTSEEGNVVGVASREEMTPASDEGQEIEALHKEESNRDKELCEDKEENPKIAHSTEGLIQNPEIEDPKEVGEMLSTDVSGNEVPEDIKNTPEQKHVSEEMIEKFDQTQETKKAPNEDMENPPSALAQEGTLIQKEENPTNLRDVFEHEPTEVKELMHEDSSNYKQVPEVEEKAKQNENEFNKATILSEEDQKGAKKGSSDIDNEEYAREERNRSEKFHIASVMDVSVDEVVAGQVVNKESNYSLITEEAREKTDEDKEKPASKSTASEELEDAQEEIVIQELHNCNMTATDTTAGVLVETNSSNMNLDEKIEASENKLEKVSSSDLVPHFQIDNLEQLQEQNLALTAEQLGTNKTCMDAEYGPQEDNGIDQTGTKGKQIFEEGNTIAVTSGKEALPVGKPEEQFSTPSSDHHSEGVEHTPKTRIQKTECAQMEEEEEEEENMNDKGLKDPPDEDKEETVGTQKQGPADLFAASRGDEVANQFLAVEELENQIQHTTSELSNKEQTSEIGKNVEKKTKETEKLVDEDPQDSSGVNRSTTVEACSEKEGVQENAAAGEDENVSTPTHPVEKVEEHTKSPSALPSTEIMNEDGTEDPALDKKSEIGEKTEEKSRETDKQANEGPEAASGADRSTTAKACSEKEGVQEHVTAWEHGSVPMPAHPADKVEEHILSTSSLPSTEILKHECTEDKKSEISENIEEKTKEAEKLVNKGPEDASGTDRSTRLEASSEEEGVQEHAAAGEDESVSTPVEKAEEHIQSPSYFPSTEILKDESIEDKKSEISENVEQKTKETRNLVNGSPEDASGTDRSTRAEACSEKEGLQKHSAAGKDESVSMPTHPTEKEEEHIPSPSSLPSTEILMDEHTEDKRSEISEIIAEKTKETVELVDEGPEEASGTDRVIRVEACSEEEGVQEHAAAGEDESVSTPTHPVKKVEEHIPSPSSFPSTDILNDECTEEKKSEINEKIQEKTKETEKLVDGDPEDASGTDKSRVEACSEEDRVQENEAVGEDESVPMPPHPAEKVEEQIPSPSSLPFTKITKDEGTEDPSEDKREESMFLQKEMPTAYIAALDHETHELKSPLDACAEDKDVTAKTSSGKVTLQNTEAFPENECVGPQNLQLEMEGERIAFPSLALLPTEEMKDEGAKELEEFNMEEHVCLEREGLTDPTATSGNEIHNDMIASADENKQKSETAMTVKRMKENAEAGEKLTKDSPDHASEADSSNENGAISQHEQFKALGATRKDETVATENFHVEKAEEHSTLPGSVLPFNNQGHDNTTEDEMDAVRMLTKGSPPQGTEETTCPENEAVEEYKTVAGDENVSSQVLPVVALLEKELLSTIEKPVGSKSEEAVNLDDVRNENFFIDKKIPEVSLKEGKDDTVASQTYSVDGLEKQNQITPSESTCEEMVHDKMTVCKDEEEKGVEESQAAETMKSETSNALELQEAEIVVIQAPAQPESDKQIQTPMLTLPSDEENLQTRAMVKIVDKDTREAELLEDKNQEPSLNAIERTRAVKQDKVLYKLEAVKGDETTTSTSSAMEEKTELQSPVIPTAKEHQTMTNVDAREEMQEKNVLKKPKVNLGEGTISPTIESETCPTELQGDSETKIPQEDHVAAETHTNFGGKHRKETSEENEITENKASSVDVREAFKTSSPISGSEGEMKDIYQGKLETSGDETEKEVFVGTESTRESKNADDNKCIEVPEKDSVALEKNKADEKEDMSTEVPKKEGGKGITEGYEKIHHQPEKTSGVVHDRQNQEEMQPTQITMTVIPAASEPHPPEKQKELQETVKEAEADLTGTGNANDNSSGQIRHGVEGEDKLQNSQEEKNVSTLPGSGKASLSNLIQRSAKERLELGEPMESKESKEAEHINKEEEHRKQESIQIKRSKIEEEDDEELEGDERQQTDSGSDALVIADMITKDTKVSPKKSHNILSGVGSKVKHSISKVKKAITGKSSHPKPASPKGENLRMKDLIRP